MTRISQPVNQVRLTNVAIVKLKHKGKRFEIACYKNKVVNWRNEVEKDLDEVLQTDSIFTNVSKGILAKNKDLQQVFGMIDQEAICRLILDKGELQVSEHEREVAHDRLYRDIATIIADKCVNPESNRPYPYTVIERVMKDALHFSPIPNKSAKQQALECIKQLRDHIPIERAKIKISISVPSKDSKPIKDYLEREDVEIVSQDWGASVKWICLLQPGLYRPCHELVQSVGKGKGIFDVLELNVQEEGEQTIEDAILFKSKRAGNDVEEEMKEERVLAAPATTVHTAGLQCSTCGGNFRDKDAHRQHFRSDWHRYNLKRKAKKQSIVEEALFEKIGAEDLEEYFKNIL